MRWLAPAPLILAPLILALMGCGDKEPEDTSSDDSGVVDADGDGHPLGEDCDDNDAEVYPGATEVCDGADNDCDGLTDDADDDVFGQQQYWSDNDRDSFGAEGAGTLSCNQPPDTSNRGGDCDDQDPAVNPDAAEVCDGVDNDCDGAVDAADDVLSGALSWYVDGDGDGYGGLQAQGCELPSDAADAGGDCDDADPEVNPDAAEVCDGVDNDCNGDIDDADASVQGTSTWYADADNDGHGAGAGIEACAQPPGTAASDGDCDDTDSSAYPGAAEVCEDAVDNNCDGAVDEACGGYTSLVGLRTFEEGFAGLGYRDCVTVFDMSGAGVAAASCPECDFAFNVTNTYDSAASTINTRCSFAPSADFTHVIGFDTDYYGAGFPVMWIGNRGYYEAYVGNDLTLDTANGLASWTYGYLDYPIGAGYYLTYYEAGVAAFY